MNADAIALVSAAVLLLTQFCKWAGLPSRYAPIAVMLLALLGVVLWALSQPEPFQREQLFSYFAAWIAVSTSAAGVYGFVRSAPEVVASFRPADGQRPGGETP